MKRKQIYLDSRSERRIQALARARTLSEAEHIRRAVVSYTTGLPDDGGTRHPLLEMIGICGHKSGPKDAAIHHDAYLYGRKR